MVTALSLTISACMPKAYHTESTRQTPSIVGEQFFTSTGESLPLHRWLPESTPAAIIVALHGFNDYGRFFNAPATYFAKHGIASYSYDQRGFGWAPKRGKWAGIPAYTSDLLDFLSTIKKQHPGTPVFVLGESMGGAVALSALQKTKSHYVDGVILVAPAIWARSTMPWYQSGLLWTLSHTVPWLTLTGGSVKVQASDNIEMLRALGRDPLVIKKTRVETIKGLADLMDKAYATAGNFHQRCLLLYGEKDQVIPKEPTYDFLQRFLAPPAPNKSIAVYAEGYHMLLRDLKAEVPCRDILAWINRAQRLPSGADHQALERLR
jgi:acylglycerol lipase